MPKISIIVPNYNHEAFLEQRLQSILRQTRSDFEVILLDDHSNDHSLKILEKYSRQLPCQLLVNTHNIGNPYKQWNRGVRATKGEYVWIAESDDYASEFFLEKLANRLEQYPHAGLAYCQSWIINEQGQQLGLNDSWTRGLDPERWQRDFYANGREECSRYMIFQNTIPNASAVLFRRSIFEEIGYVDETFSYAGDWHTWIRMLQVSDLCFCIEPLNYYRTHPGSLRKKALNGTRQVEEAYRILNWLLTHAKITETVAEKARDRVMQRWQLALTARAANWLPNRNYRIYRSARPVDHQAVRRFARKLWARAIQKIRRSWRN